MTTFAFDTKQTGCSLVNALACARAALLAYGDEATVDAAADEWGFSSRNGITCGTDYFIVLGNRDMILVAFRGTDDFNDFRTSVNVLYRKSPLGRVHRGFMDAVIALWPNLAACIQRVRDNNQRIWFTGHSLGGALAVLASIKAQFEDQLPVGGLYTFGQPPIGTTGFCLAFEKQCPFPLYRFINHTDAVSDVPMLTLLEHVGDVRYFDLSGKMWEGTPPFRVSLSDHWNAPRTGGGMSNFKAHSMSGYIDLITRCLDSQPADPQHDPT